MNDRHLFKAKRVDNGEWVIGYLFRISEENNPFIMLSDRHAESHEIQTDTLCQCTGYKGIYEHDIFQCDDDVYEIIWSDDSLEWEAVSINSSESISLGEFRSTEINVIGNSIDNHELLGSED